VDAELQNYTHYIITDGAFSGQVVIIRLKRKRNKYCSKNYILSTSVGKSMPCLQATLRQGVMRTEVSERQSSKTGRQPEVTLITSS
jgi:hypothetical protein